MPNEYETKDMKPEQTRTKAPSRTRQAPKIAFHFAGSGAYAPITIEAHTRAEAEKEWREKRASLKVDN